MDAGAKDLVKKLLVGDVDKRYGCMKGGVEDIKYHKWFKGFQWEKCKAKQLKAFYVPKLAHDGDAENFSSYVDEKAEAEGIDPANDPFLFLKSL